MPPRVLESSQTDADGAGVAMKMKTIFILLNAVLATAFLVIFFTPLLLLGVDWFNVFWKNNWPIAIVFVVTLAAVDAYFLSSWKLFTSLEKENWPEVAGFLEARIFNRKWIRAGHVRLLLNTYLVASNTEGVLALEAFLSTRKPILVPRFSLAFGIPHLLAKDPADPEAFFGRLLSQPRLSEPDWVRWNHAFSLLQLKRGEEAREELRGLVKKQKDPVLTLLSLYLMDAMSGRGVDAEMSAARDALRAAQTPVAFQKALQKSEGNIQVVVLSRLLQDAVQWLFAEPAVAAAAPAGSSTAGPSPEVH
jgi:hypothetical protein